MAERNLAIRLSVVDGGKVKAELSDVGEALEKSLKRIESASQLALAGLQIVSKAANDAFAQMEDATLRLGMLGPAGLIAGGLPQIGVFSRANSRNTQADTSSRGQEQLDEVAWQRNT